MGFVIRALFVIGVLYLISPLRAALPDWLAKPSAGTVQLAALPTLATAVGSAPLSASVENLGKAALAVCKGHEKACMEAASSALKTNEPKSSDTGDAIAALLKETAVPEKPRSVAIADAAPESPVIPLPPRRDIAPVAPAPAQKKI
jgi:hypothetical protein